MIGRHWIDGRWDAGADTDRIIVVNPADGSTVGSVPRGAAADVEHAVAAARRALPAWAALSIEERIAHVERLSAGIAARRDEIAAVLSAEMGAPIEFAKAAQVGVALADLTALIEAARAHREQRPMSNSLVVTEPVGVVAAITPWNFPLHQIALKVGAAMLAGCTTVLKPSEIAPLNAVLLAEIADGAGMPAGVLNIVHGDGLSVGAPLTGHPDVDMVTFTGSREVGAEVARAAAPQIKRVALELGGKSAAIVLDDAPLAETAEQLVRSCFANAGQTCAALSRALVPQSRLREWEEALVAAAEEWTLGDPAESGTRMGPLASTLQRDRVREHIEAAVAEGAKPLLLKDAPSGLPSEGAWVAPAVFGDVTPDMRLFREEVFGPVLAITPYRDEDHAVELANDSVYGLAGGVWSQDPEHALAVARRIRTGTIGINGAGLDVGAPFGGVKQSGVGREGGVHGFEEFLEVKAIMGAADLAG